MVSGQSMRRLVSGLMVGLLLWGVWQRLDSLDAKSLWSDELFTLGMAQYQPLLPKEGQPLYRQIQVTDIGVNDSFWTAKAAEQSPPLNDLLVKAALNLPGPTEIASRLPAALSSCVLLLFFAIFAWRHPDPSVRRILQWSTALLVLHPALVLYAREGRAYSLGVSLVGMGALLWMLRWRNGWREWQAPGWGEIALFTLACYSHYNAALLVALLLSADAFMATWQRSLRAWARLLTLGLIFSGWLALNAHAILFTAGGGVAWTYQSPTERLALAHHDALAALHPPWLWLAAGALVCVTLVRWQQIRSGHAALWPRQDVVRVVALAAITMVYLALAALVVSNAGMGHPRFFIFVIPVVSVMMALVLAAMRPGWLAPGALAAAVLLAAPNDRLKTLMGHSDFRSMGLAGARGSDDSTHFVFPLEANRNFYRAYLHRFLGEDPSPRMIGITHAGEVARVCEQIKVHRHVVVFEHAAAGLINSLRTTCVDNWPLRERKEFYLTSVEHWRRP